MGEAGGGRGEAVGWQAEQEGPAVHQPPAWPASRRVCDTRGKGEPGVGRRAVGARGRGRKGVSPSVSLLTSSFFPRDI